jgi:hypothetical protein
VVVVDVDPRPGGDDALLDLEREHGEVPPTWRCLTAHGGLHLYFRHPGGTISNRVNLWPGIDLRADGGYVVAPPTALDGDRHYVWEIGGGPHEVPLASPPSWLLERLTRSSRHHQPNGAAPLFTVGARNDSLMRIGAALRRYGVGQRAIAVALQAINQTHCQPRLPASEVDRIAASVARYPAGTTFPETSGQPSHHVVEIA